MSKLYKVWVVVEEYDTETKVGHPIGLGEKLAECININQAYQQVMTLKETYKE